MIGWADIKRMAANVNSKGDNFSLPGRIITILALLGGVLGFAVFFSYSCYFIKERFRCLFGTELPCFISFSAIRRLAILRICS